MALTLAAWLLSGLVAFLAGTLRWAERVSDRAEAIELARTVWVILDEETRPGVPGRDWTLASPQAIELRAFRGVARVCGAEGGRWATAYRGLRVPDPDRDSVLVLGADGGWRARALTGSWAGGDLCELDAGASARLLEWSGAAGAAPVLVRVFERGRYSLEDGAFRYRRGQGGRQPLTLERLGAGSRFELQGSALRVVLEVRGGSPEGTGRILAWRVAVGEPGNP